MKFNPFFLVVLGILFGAGNTRADSETSGYRVVKKIPLGGEGGWDYLTLDPDSRRLYIARFDRVMVMNVESGKLVGELADTPGVHGVALVPKLNRGFSSNGKDSTVTAFDLKTLREVARIKVGKRPDAILYDPSSRRVFTFNAGSQDATAIDPASAEVVGTVPLGGKPEFGVADEQGMIYVNLEDKTEIVGFDATRLKIKHRWPLAPGAEPAGLAIDPKNRRLFSTCHNQKMVILDADSGRVLASPAIGQGTDACVFDPDAGLAFSSNGDGTLTVIGEDGPGKFRVTATVLTQAGARTMALDSQTHQIFLATARAKPGQRRSYEPGSFVILVVGK